MVLKSRVPPWPRGPLSEPRHLALFFHVPSVPAVLLSRGSVPTRGDFPMINLISLNYILSSPWSPFGLVPIAVPLEFPPALFASVFSPIFAKFFFLLYLRGTLNLDGPVQRESPEPCTTKCTTLTEKFSALFTFALSTTDLSPYFSCNAELPPAQIVRECPQGRIALIQPIRIRSLTSVRLP